MNLMHIFTISLLIVFILFNFSILNFLKKSNLKYKLLFYIIFALLVSVLFSVGFMWGKNNFEIGMLKYYNAYVYNPDSDSYQIEYYNVSKENLEEVKIIETSYMGIGWPLKAIFMFVIIFPFLLIVYLLNFSFYKKNQMIFNS